MVTLLDNPIIITQPSLTMHLYQPCLPSQELNASILMLATMCKHLISSDAILCDCPMTITMTAAASNAVDDEQPPAHSTSSLADESHPDSLSLFIQEWNTFYNKFVQSLTYQLADPMATPFDCNVVDAANNHFDPTHVFSSKMNESTHSLV